MTDSEAELETILRKFAGFIRMRLFKFTPARFGLDAEDLAQEVRVKIWRVLRSGKKVGCPTSYIKKIIDSTVIDHIRKIKREENVYNFEVERKTSELKTMYSSLSTRNRELKDLVWRAAEGLIDSRKRVVKLFLMNLSIEEIADALHWSRDKTRNLLYRGLADLRKTIKDWTETDGD
jgi:RNA polymerase sigma-70 factor (ECF subfamily)